RALSITFFMSCGARNWPFLMFTGRPLCATARMKSVWRHRKAGVCSTSQTAAAGAMSSSLCTSVITGTPSSALTLASTARPASRPGPRKLLPLLRLALSKLLLKMKGMPSEAVISFSRPATSSCSCSDSMTQGPAIRKKGLSSPTSNPQSCMGRSSGDGLGRRALRLVGERGLHVGIEQRVAVPGRGFEFRVELHAHVPGVHALRQLHDLRQVLALGERGDHQAGRAQLVEVVHVGFVVVAVALGDHVAVDAVRQGALGHVGALCAQAPGAAEV